jgi:hypothetical protein
MGRKNQGNAEYLKKEANIYKEDAKRSQIRANYEQEWFD